MGEAKADEKCPDCGKTHPTGKTVDWKAAVRLAAAAKRVPHEFVPTDPPAEEIKDLAVEIIDVASDAFIVEASARMMLWLQDAAKKGEKVQRMTLMYVFTSALADSFSALGAHYKQANDMAAQHYAMSKVSDDETRH